MNKHTTLARHICLHYTQRNQVTARWLAIASLLGIVCFASIIRPLSAATAQTTTTLHTQQLQSPVQVYPESKQVPWPPGYNGRRTSDSLMIHNREFLNLGLIVGILVIGLALLGIYRMKYRIKTQQANKTYHYAPQSTMLGYGQAPKPKHPVRHNP